MVNKDNTNYQELRRRVIALEQSLFEARSFNMRLFNEIRLIREHTGMTMPSNKSKSSKSSKSSSSSTNNNTKTVQLNQQNNRQSQMQQMQAQMQAQGQNNDLAVNNAHLLTQITALLQQQQQQQHMQQSSDLEVQNALNEFKKFNQQPEKKTRSGSSSGKPRGRPRSKPLNKPDDVDNKNEKQSDNGLVQES